MPNILIERIVPWTLNGSAQSPFLCTPEHLSELALGHLLSQGTIARPEDILSIHELPIADENGCAAQLEVTLQAGVHANHRDILTRLQALSPIQSDFTISKPQLIDMCERLLSDEAYFGVHRLMLSCNGQEIFREDAGRHNAADKLIAYAALNHWDFSKTVMGATGRISLEMLAKVAQMGIPVFFSRKYPSDAAVWWAKKLGIAIVSRAHSEKMDVFGATERMI